MNNGVNIPFTLNGKAVVLSVPPDFRVADLLREDSGLRNLHVIFKSSISIMVSKSYIIEARSLKTRAMSCVAGMAAMTIRGNTGFQDLLPIIKNGHECVHVFL
jgi:aerobic-type carbon monoxide dehydrogenase small subunit (CoxS/CutS family)